MSTSQDPSKRKFLTFLLGALASIVTTQSTSAKTNSSSHKSPSKKKAPVKSPPKKTLSPSSKQDSTPAPSSSKIVTTPKVESSPTPSPLKENLDPSSPDAPKEIIYDGQFLKVENIPIGRSLLAKYPIDRGFQSLIVTRVALNNFVGFIPVCPHQRGLISIDGNVLLCSRHSAKFDRFSGEIISGPTSQPLVQEKIEVNAGKLYRVANDDS